MILFFISLLLISLLVFLRTKVYDERMLILLIVSSQ